MGNIPLLDISTFNDEQLSVWVVAHFEKAFRAKQISEWLWKKNVSSFDEMSNLPSGFIQTLKEHFYIPKIKIAEKQVSSDGSIKYAVQLHDKHWIEMVLIPAKKRSTVCVSSQVGCGLNCRFCATAHVGFSRNLTAYEMYEQVFRANQESMVHFGHPISNIVWMGMGEPLLNYENVMQAIDYITTAKGMGMSKDRITLSSCGIVKGIRQLADDKSKVHLAISLHSAHLEQRSDIMPINKSNPLPALSNALVYYYQKTNQRITIEYLLLNGENDSLEHARLLAIFCKRFPVKINIIEYNPHPYAVFSATNKQQQALFIDYLKNKNLVVNLRLSKGKDIAAACGQLAKKRQA
ncbi:MAG: 23S rRNA (adenine(2503)-C(2))-methyltransferase RlmN [Bacteroidales bacterium]|jgi:23S rRNA (adenine2503-C2)-methyltransferase|nr:23S rRNA (adenine(2503)-C(2))-methyltransferase RlmN [Bacteroidales bacterium]NLO42958.1 23S rRNA (adenine(2503)-C(2))-methyltransferase RlmN [Bacteroidales bacterium]